MLQQIRSAESSLAADLRQATAELSAVAGPDLDAALDDLRKAADGAKARLQKAADRARGVLLALAGEAAGLSARLALDLSGPERAAGPAAPARTAEPQPAENCATIARDAAEPGNGPAVAPDARRALEEAMSAGVKEVAAGEGWTETVTHPPLPDRTARLVEALARGAGPVPTLEQVEAQVNARHQDKPRPAPSSNGKAPRTRKR